MLILQFKGFFLSAPNTYTDLNSIWVKCAGVWAKVTPMKWNVTLQNFTPDLQHIYTVISDIYVILCNSLRDEATWRWQWQIQIQRQIHWEHLQRAILVTCDIWDTGSISDNWELEILTILVTWQLRVTLDSIHNASWGLEKLYWACLSLTEAWQSYSGLCKSVQGLAKAFQGLDKATWSMTMIHGNW